MKNDFYISETRVQTILLAFILIALLFGSNFSQAENTNIPNFLKVSKTDSIKGDSNILLIEYSDYECPFCQRFHLVAQKLVDDNRVSWVYRHLPLPIHRTALEGSIIASCVLNNKGEDSFWSYTDSVFVGSRASLEKYEMLAMELGLTEDEINSCLEQGSEERLLVEEHMSQAELLGIRGTPGSVLINKKTGKTARIPGALPIDEVEKLILSIQ